MRDGSLAALRWMVGGGPGVLPNGSLASVRFGGSFDAIGASHTARATTATVGMGPSPELLVLVGTDDKPTDARTAYIPQ